MMIKPIHNREAINILSANSTSRQCVLNAAPLLARECNALIQADRYLAQADKGKHES